MGKSRPRSGRRKQPEDQKTERLNVKVKPSAKARYWRAAKVDGYDDFSDWVRDQLDAACEARGIE